jgi:hypothetical protein
MEIEPHFGSSKMASWHGLKQEVDILHRRIRELEDGACRFNCRKEKVAFKEGWNMRAFQSSGKRLLSTGSRNVSEYEFRKSDLPYWRGFDFLWVKEDRGLWQCRYDLISLDKEILARCYSGRWRNGNVS